MKPPRPSSTFVALAVLTGGATPAPDPKDGPPCHLCTARCCKYLALQIDTPTTPTDHDQIRWFMLHHGVVVWMQDGEWYLEVHNPCKHLQPDNRCGIYDTRPQICRDYGLPDGDEAPCEFFNDDATYDLYFASAEAFDVWSREELERRERRLARRRQLRQSRKEQGQPEPTEVMA
jgi:Fe-S-cluster containining protein